MHAAHLHVAIGHARDACNRQPLAAILGNRMPMRRVKAIDAHRQILSVQPTLLVVISRRNTAATLP
jgi:hypothetical protein